MTNLIESLCSALELDIDALKELAVRAPKMYKAYSIPKKNGGLREVEQPYKIIKKAQYTILDGLTDLPVHKTATAYEKNSSIKANAEAHKSNQYILKLDFKDFFHSIRPRDFRKHLSIYLEKRFTRQELAIIWRFLFVAKKRNRKAWLCLSIGAPSSPRIANSMMYIFDECTAKECEKLGIIYTRYSDDLTFSTNIPNQLKNIQIIIAQIIEKHEFNFLKINNAKSTYLSKKNSRRVTGLIITNSGKVSIGRARKRTVKSMCHKFYNNELTDDEILILNGWLAFILDVEPNYIMNLRGKYRHSLIEDIKRAYVNVMKT